jgi:hypothetical protein
VLQHLLQRQARLGVAHQQLRSGSTHDFQPHAGSQPPFCSAHRQHAAAVPVRGGHAGACTTSLQRPHLAMHLLHHPTFI